MQALSKGWSLLSLGMEELGKVAAEGARAAVQGAGQLSKYANEQWNDPNLRNNVSEYVNSFSRKVESLLESTTRERGHYEENYRLFLTNLLMNPKRFIRLKNYTAIPFEPTTRQVHPMHTIRIKTTATSSTLRYPHFSNSNSSKIVL